MASNYPSHKLYDRSDRSRACLSLLQCRLALVHKYNLAIFYMSHHRMVSVITFIPYDEAGNCHTVMRPSTHVLKMNDAWRGYYAYSIHARDSAVYAWALRAPTDVLVYIS